MGCASSKPAEVARDVYRPPPTSISLFDITKVEEPWLIGINNDKLQDQDNGEEEEDDDIKKNHITSIPQPLLEKLDSYNEAAPTSWTEVSKALEDLKPSIESSKTAPLTAPSNLKKQKSMPTPRPTSNPSAPAPAPASTHVPFHIMKHSNSSRAFQELGDIRPVKNNSFIIQDKGQKKVGNEAIAAAIAMWKKKRDPLESYPQQRPPGKGGDGVVLYTTSLRGVRRTFEDCDRARKAVEAYAVEAGIRVEERDVSLHGEYLKEVRELVGEGVAVPRLFMRGRYIGGIEEVIELAETSKMREMLKWVVEGRGERKECEGCGGARFVPCWFCNGSRKVVAEDGKSIERCGVCNENGLAMCPICN